MKKAKVRTGPQGFADAAVSRRDFLGGVAAVASATALGGAPAWVSAQPGPGSFPDKPIRMVSPFSAGGPTEVVGRLLIQKLMVTLGQTVILDSRPGAGGILGSSIVAKAPPDGYTWLLTSGSHTSNSVFNENVPYDPIRDFTPVTLVAQNWLVLIVHPSLPAKTVQELIALAKARPDKLNYASAGVGNVTYVAAETMKAETGVDIEEIQYKGVAPALNDVLAGHVDMMFVPTTTALPFIQAGKVRALAMTGPSRWKKLPDVPTMQESGLKDFSVGGWFGLWLPPGTPSPLVERIYADMAKALAQPDVKQTLDEVGLETGGSRPEVFAKFVEQDLAGMKALAQRIAQAKKK